MSKIKDKYLVTKYIIASSGDIREEQTFSLSNSVTSFADVTDFSFTNATVRSFKAWVSVEIDATADLFEAFEITGIQKGSGWDLHYTSIGDDSLVTFNITATGQIQYKSGSYAGFSSGSIKFKAETTSI